MSNYIGTYNGKSSDLEKAKIKAENKALLLYKKEQYEIIVRKIENHLRLYNAKIDDYEYELDNLEYPEDRDVYDGNEIDGRFEILQAVIAIPISLGIMAALKSLFGFSAAFMGFAGPLVPLVALANGVAYVKRPIGKTMYPFRSFIKQKRIDKLIKKYESTKSLLNTLKKLNGEEVIEEQPKKSSKKESETKNIYNLGL